jgi:diguanylate cyclase (GGDEF)-like protein
LLIFVAIVLSSLGSFNLLKNRDFKKQKNKIEQENNMDLLTTAFNRKHGTIEFKKAFNEFEKNGNSPAIMMFDIDNFKHVNDTFGHAAGDQVLKDIINVVSNNKKRMELT